MPARVTKATAVAILAVSWAALAGGCVSIPVPPADMGKAKRGEMGTLIVKITAEYKPNWIGVTQAALRQFAGDNKEVKAPVK